MPFAPRSVLLLLVVRPGAPSSLLLLVAMPFAPSSVLVPSSDALCATQQTLPLGRRAVTLRTTIASSYKLDVVVDKSGRCCYTWPYLDWIHVVLSLTPNLMPFSFLWDQCRARLQ